MYFRLLPEVYLVVGKNKSLLQNILSKKSLWIDNNLAYLLKECEKNKTVPVEQKEIFESLSDNNWGIISNNPIFIDKYRLTNIFNNKRFFKDVPYISSAILKLTNDCNLSCYNCGKVFCPTCFKSENTDRCMSLKKWKEVVRNLKKFGCKHIILTGGECVLYPDLMVLCDFISYLNMTFTVSTNGMKRVEGYNKKLSILISLFDADNISKIVENYKEYKNVTLVVYCSLENKKNIAIPSEWTVLISSTRAPKINKNNMPNMDIFNFFLRKEHNKCLNGKIAIMENGDVYPCLGACISDTKFSNYCVNNDFDYDIIKNKKVGNVIFDKWSTVIKSIMENYWNNKIDDDMVCALCEFRYACDRCIFNDPRQNCNYILEESLWK